MTYTETYLQKIRDRGNPQLADSIAATINGIAPNYLENFSFCDNEVGLLFGNVQSGKTGQMFGVICAAADLGFPVFLLLTTDNKVLQEQTIDRVREDLDGFCICDEYDSEIFAENNLIQPTIIVLKKNFHVLKQWANILKNTGFMRGNPLFIIDDEADAASLNALVNKHRQTTINRYLDAIKADSSCSIYLQVTGTPQALLLQTMASGWHPYFTYYFRPGNAYLGGDFFFPKQKPECISYIDSLKDPLLVSTLHHLFASAQALNTGKKVCNFLIHPSVSKASHKKFCRDVEAMIAKIGEKWNETELEKLCLSAYQDLHPQKSELLPYDTLRSYVKSMLDSKMVKTIIMNGDTKISSDEYATGCNIVIGGNTLGRGVTFSGLQTIYYSRTAKKPQADTMWQHSRMFGYDRDPGMMRVFIEEKLYKLFSDINATNNSIIAQVEKGVKDIKIYYPEGLSPTRQAVLDNDHVSVISGGTNYYPFDPQNTTIADIDKLLRNFSDEEPYYQVNLRLMKEIFSHIIPSADFRQTAFVSFIDMMLAEKPAAQGILIVRRNRNVAKGTGALLSPNDWKLGGSFSDKVVLTMYQMTGEKGWNGEKIWVPNIKFPDNAMYYDVDEPETE